MIVLETVKKRWGSWKEKRKDREKKKIHFNWILFDFFVMTCKLEDFFSLLPHYFNCNRESDKLVSFSTNEKKIYFQNIQA